jgi:Flp pilus assembly protein TadD
VLASTLAALRGITETIDRTAPENLNGRSALWFSVAVSPGGQPNSVYPLSTAHSSAGTVSAKRLRHQVPKAARQAYDRALGSRDAGKAANELENAVRIDPDFAEAHHALGVIYTRQRRPEAVAEFRRTIELAPEESLPYSNLAWVLFAMGQRAEAETNVRRAIELSPENATAHLLMGCLLVQTPQALLEGIRHLEYAARTIPEAEQMAKVLRRK